MSMNLDPTKRALVLDIDAVRSRIREQMERDPDNEVALAMYRADLRRAKLALEQYEAAPVPRQEPAVRRYIDGRLAA